MNAALFEEIRRTAVHWEISHSDSSQGAWVLTRRGPNDVLPTVIGFYATQAEADADAKRRIKAASDFQGRTDAFARGVL